MTQYISITDSLIENSQKYYKAMFKNITKLAKINTNFVENMILNNPHITPENYKDSIKSEFSEFIDCGMFNVWFFMINGWFLFIIFNFAKSLFLTCLDYMHNYPEKISNIILETLVPNTFCLLVSLSLIYLFIIPLIVFAIISMRINTKSTWIELS